MIVFSRDIEMLKLCMEAVANGYETHTKPYNGDKTKKVRAKSGRATSSNHKLENFVSLSRIQLVLSHLYMRTYRMLEMMNLLKS